MRSIWQTIVIACISMGSFGCSPRQGLSAKEVYARTADQVVTIECWNGNYIKTKQGSGIVLGHLSEKHGVDILTNYHVINGSGLIRVRTRKGDAYKANILYFDALTDTALIRLDRVEYQPASPRLAGDISVGDTVYSVGAPKGLGWTMTSGIISGIRSDRGVKLVQTSASISSGSSGGALFNASGELIGITSFYLKEAQNLNFAVAVSEEFLSSLRRFREQEAALAEYMPDDFWFIGHYEPGDDLEKPSSPALKRWAIYQQKWEALAREQLDNWKASEDLNAYAKTDAEISKLLAERYAEFPNDHLGFVASLDFANDRRAKINELLAASEKWPGELDIIQALYSALGEDESLPPKVILKPLSAFVDALPSASEVEELTGYKFAPGRYRVQLVVNQIRPILYLVDHTLRGIREREKTTARIRATLEEKGWNVKRE